MLVPLSLHNFLYILAAFLFIFANSTPWQGRTARAFQKLEQAVQYRYDFFDDEGVVLLIIIDKIKQRLHGLILLIGHQFASEIIGLPD